MAAESRTRSSVQKVRKEVRFKPRRSSGTASRLAHFRTVPRGILISRSAAAKKKTSRIDLLTCWDALSPTAVTSAEAAPGK